MKARADEPEEKTADVRSLRALRVAVEGCRACPLWRNATHGVPGEGARHAEVILVGEQPGDAEDLSGHPFVGPAGKLLDRALALAGVARETVFVTNVVKHFKWEPRGKRRIHKTPAQQEIAACMDWLRLEAKLIKPRVIVWGGSRRRRCSGRASACCAIGVASSSTRSRPSSSRPCTRRRSCACPTTRRARRRWPRWSPTSPSSRVRWRTAPTARP